MKKKSQVGLMLLKEMFPRINELKDHVDFFQVPAEEYYSRHGIEDLDTLQNISKIKPLHIHSIDLSIGSEDGISENYLNVLNTIHKNVKVVTYSDHIGFSRAGGLWTGMPILNTILTNESIDVIVGNINKVLKVIKGSSFLIENNSHCIKWPGSKIAENKFSNSICRKTESKIILDIPNMLADARNFGFDPKKYIKGLDVDSVSMIHIAGGDWLDGYKENKITRGHFKKVEEEVWDLLQYVFLHHVPRYVTLERSRNINIEEIIDELKKLRTICH